MMEGLGREKLWVLVLDDSKVTLYAIGAALEAAGFEVVTASSLPEFDRLVTKGRPDIILTDIMMPEISGDDVCRVLKSHAGTRTTPVVLFSAVDEEELASLAETSGADGYISKNAGLEEIVRYVKTIAEAVGSGGP